GGQNEPPLHEALRELDLPALDSLYLDGSPTNWVALLDRCRRPLRRVHMRCSAEFPYDVGFYDIWDRLQASPHWPTLREATVWYALDTVHSGRSDETAYF